MKKLFITGLFIFGFAPAAKADIWQWVDALGKVHLVDTMTPIYTWLDENGKVAYADHPGHEDAVTVNLIWRSTGTLDDPDESRDEPDAGGYAYAGETAEQRAERERAEAYYCQRATEIYESYLNAPQLYKTDDNGERQYLSKADVESTIEETRVRKDELCE